MASLSRPKERLWSREAGRFRDCSQERAVTISVLLTEVEVHSMRMLLLVAVIALGADALLYNGAYTQAAWREGSIQIEKLLANAQPAPKEAEQGS
jgi:hypothetical protein